MGTLDPACNKYNPNVPLRQPWNDIYLPKTNIPNTASAALATPIMYEELKAVLMTLPNNKAPGPSGIPYDIIKKFSTPLHENLVSFFNCIIDHNVLPSRWQEALLYPIPKPEWWDNDISLTRPIVLLDTFRKILTKIFNTRLNKYLSNNNILEHNNRVGVQGSSYMEIIFQFQAAITTVKTLKKDLYIIIQDLSKAYDWVEIPLLRLA